jgi:transaldolase / glucose-6-phosphate isomerase
MTKLHQLAAVGQSIWLDYIRRDLLDSGELARLVDLGLGGMTSNPSIFDKAISNSDEYDEALRELVVAGKTPLEIYEALALSDIRRAADILRPVYDATAGADGYVSLEVPPDLAHDSQATIAEAHRLFLAVARPNVFIKVPATPAGIPAIETLIGQGVNVNVTLMFSLDHYDRVAEAYIRGLEHLAATGGDLSRVASVASFFVSRVDSAVDRALREAGDDELLGKIGIANAKLAYERFLHTFCGLRWARLVGRGARVQRPLWASTSTKDPAYPDTMYVDNLIGPHTVNTLPPETLDALVDHGTVAVTLTEGVDEAHAQVARLAELGIDLDAITEQLQDEGVKAFARSFDALIDTITHRRGNILAELSLGGYAGLVQEALARMRADRIVERIWQRDYTVWKPEPDEIENRLGWLRSPQEMEGAIDRMCDLAAEVRAAGYTDVLILGMGGSSLASEVFATLFGHDADGYPDVRVLDSTDPGAVRAHSERLDPERTLFVVATKSGGTVETFSFFKYFYNWMAAAVGQENAGAHLVAITDPGSELERLAGERGFRSTFLNDPEIGGRYSALSFFGLVPAALAGVDVARLLARAREQAELCAPHPASLQPATPGNETDCAWLGAVLGTLALAGRDKVTVITSPPLASLGEWIEQLLAESTGKEGKGILPVIGEPVGPPAVYGDDRLFVYLRLDGDETHDERVEALAVAGHPVVILPLRDRYDVGAHFFLWEMATAIAGAILGINPFDQPDVESAKVMARRAVAAYTDTGELPPDRPEPVSAAALARFLATAQAGDYVAIQAYLEPTAEVDASLSALREYVRDHLRLATTVGYGPRFLHSTGQLHKGDAGRGLFVQLTADSSEPLPIPDQAGARGSSIDFGLLVRAQALGDKRALENAGRRVIRFHLGHDPAGELARLVEELA